MRMKNQSAQLIATFSELAASRKSSNSELGMPVLLN